MGGWLVMVGWVVGGYGEMGGLLGREVEKVDDGTSRRGRGNYLMYLGSGVFVRDGIFGVLDECWRGAWED